MKNKGERETYIQLNTDFQRTAQTDKKVFFNEQCIKLGKKKKTERERLEISSGKLEMSREHFTQAPSPSVVSDSLRPYGW